MLEQATRGAAGGCADNTREWSSMQRDRRCSMGALVAGWAIPVDDHSHGDHQLDKILGLMLRVMTES